MSNKNLFFILLILFISGCVAGESTRIIIREGPFNVTYVVDGDTLDINTTTRIRLSGINTPEKGECYYKEAKEKLKELTYGKEVYLERDITNIDKYGRALRYIYVGDLSVSSYLVEKGYAKVFDKYKDDTKKYDELKEVEKIAIANNLGVWACS